MSPKPLLRASSGRHKDSMEIETSVAERASEHEFNRANALERACAEKDRRIATQAEAIAELTRRRDELESWHGDEKTWRVGAEQERDDAMQRIKALEDDSETAGEVMGAVCVLATLRPGEKYAGPTDHAAVYAVVSMLAQRDALVARVGELEAQYQCVSCTYMQTERDQLRAKLQTAVAVLEDDLGSDCDSPGCNRDCDYCKPRAQIIDDARALLAATDKGAK